MKIIDSLIKMLTPEHRTMRDLCDQMCQELGKTSRYNWADLKTKTGPYKNKEVFLAPEDKYGAEVFAFGVRVKFSKPNGYEYVAKAMKALQKREAGESDVST